MAPMESVVYSGGAFVLKLTKYLDASTMKQEKDYAIYKGNEKVGQITKGFFGKILTSFVEIPKNIENEMKKLATF